MSTTETSRIEHDDELPAEATPAVVETPATQPAETQPIKPFEYASKSPNHKEPMPRRTKIGIALGGVATAAVLVTLLAVIPSGGSGNGKAGASTPKPTETSQSDQPTSNPNGGEVSGDILTQTTSVEAMDSMDLTSYAKLSYADHLAYAYAKNPEMAITTPDKDLGFTTPASIPPYFWDSVNGTAIGEADTTEGAKIAAANDYYTADVNGEIATGYQGVIDSVKQGGGEGIMNSATLVFVDSGKPQTGVDRAGNKINYINVTYYVADSTSGKREGADKTAQAIRQEVKLLNGKTIVFYPIGFNVPGHAAPDGGTY